MARSVHSKQEDSKHTTIAVPTAGGTIQLYQAGSVLNKREELQIHHRDGNAGRKKILKLAFSPKTTDLAVLYTQEICPDERYNQAETTHKLVIFHLQDHIYDSDEQETWDVTLLKDERVLGFSLSPNGIACIVCQNENLCKRDPLVKLVYRNDEL